MDLLSGRQLGHRVLPFHRLQNHLGLESRMCFLRPWGISHSSLAATAALSLGAGLSLSYLSRFLGPPHGSYIKYLPIFEGLSKWQDDLKRSLVN